MQNLILYLTQATRDPTQVYERIVTIFDRRSVSASGIALYLAFSYQQSHRLHTEYTFLYATKKERGK